MRIELPLPAWAESAQRADDDAHTLTVAPSVAADWVAWQWPSEPAPCVRVAVAATRAQPLTLTL
jgi:hypothetical protein